MEVLATAWLDEPRGGSGSTSCTIDGRCGSSSAYLSDPTPWWSPFRSPPP